MGGRNRTSFPSSGYFATQRGGNYLATPRGGGYLAAPTGGSLLPISRTGGYRYRLYTPSPRSSPALPTSPPLRLPLRHISPPEPHHRRPWLMGSEFTLAARSPTSLVPSPTSEASSPPFLGPLQPSLGPSSSPFDLSSSPLGSSPGPFVPFPFTLASSPTDSMMPAAQESLEAGTPVVSRQPLFRGFSSASGGSVRRRGTRGSSRQPLRYIK